MVSRQRMPRAIGANSNEATSGTSETGTPRAGAARVSDTRVPALRSALDPRGYEPPAWLERLKIEGKFTGNPKNPDYARTLQRLADHGAVVAVPDAELTGDGGSGDTGAVDRPRDVAAVAACDHGGHPMMFRRFDGQLMMSLHVPNEPPNERIQLFEMEDTGDTVRILRKFPAEPEN